MLKNEIVQIAHFEGPQNEEMMNNIVQTLHISSIQHTHMAEFF